MQPPSHERIATLSPALERLEVRVVGSVLSARAAIQFSQGAISAAELAPVAHALKALSQDYVSERVTPLAPLFALDMAKAYALYFMPVNFAKVLYLLDELPEDFKRRPIAVLDYGCGPGTASLAFQEWSSQPPTSLTLVDHSPAMLEQAQALVRAEGHAVDFQSTAQFTADSRRFDLILLANVLTELPSPARAQLLAQLCSRLTATGTILILEPALQRVTREMQALRDTIVREQEDMVPLFPCTRRDSCPMLLEDEESWCHGTLRWQPSRLVTQLDQLTGFNKHRLKYTAFIFQRGAKLRSGLRILEAAERKKFGLAITVCGESCYGAQIVSKRNSPEEVRLQLTRADQFELLPLDKGIFARA